jgi:hypothetical protein
MISLVLMLMAILLNRTIVPTSALSTIYCWQVVSQKVSECNFESYASLSVFISILFIAMTLKMTGIVNFSLKKLMPSRYYDSDENSILMQLIRSGRHKTAVTGDIGDDTGIYLKRCKLTVDSVV